MFRKFQGIAGQVVEHLFDTYRVADETLRQVLAVIGEKPQAFGHGVVLVYGDDLAENLAQIKGRLFQREHARLNLRNIQDVIDDAE